MYKKIAVLSILLMSLALNSFSEDSIVIKDAWIRQAPPGSSITAAYMTIENKGAADTLINVSSNAADRIEIHASKVDENDIVTMEKIESVSIGSGETAKFEPGGMHLMLIGIKEYLVGKDLVKLELEFEQKGEIAIQIPVKREGNSGHKHHH